MMPGDEYVGIQIGADPRKVVHNGVERFWKL